MKTKSVVILVTLLLSVSSVNAQDQEISRLKTHTITLSRRISKNKKDTTQFWILVESEGKQLKPVEFKGPPSRFDKSPSMDVVDASASAMNVGQVQ
ncbi:MAG TPA: hypothetical protein VLE19_09320, partial [Pyrinomonadaceae bacterium]|nr:hypothetical protein [Pyrinomonadaceae bacterium]